MGLGVVRESFMEKEAPSWLCRMGRVLIAVCKQVREGQRRRGRKREGEMSVRR